MTLVDIEKEELNNEADMAARFLEQFIMDRVRPTRDLAKLPIITSGVMQTSVSKEDVIDFLKEFRIQEEETNLLLLDISGEPIIENRNKNLKINLTSDQTNSLLGGDKDFLVNIHKHDHEASIIQISVPVRYRHSVEGIIVSYIPFDIDSIFSSLLGGGGRFIRLTQNNVNIFSENKNNESNNISIEKKLYGLGITLNYFFDQKVLKKKK